MRRNDCNIHFWRRRMPNTKRLWLYLTGVLLMAGAGILTVSGFPFDTQFLTTVKKNGVDLELRSEGKMMADEVLSGRIMLEADATPSPVSKEDRDEEVEFRGDNVQVNDPALDNIQTFAGLRPFVKFTQSETTVAAHNDNIVVSYNSSAGVKLVRLPTGQVVFQEILLSGFSTSNDRGRTFTSGFVPPVRGASATFGDGVVTVDEEGNFYYSTLGIDAQGNGTVQVNRSTNGGRTWSDAVVAAVDDGSDKEWIAPAPLRAMTTGPTSTSPGPASSKLLLRCFSGPSCGLHVRRSGAPPGRPRLSSPRPLLRTRSIRSSSSTSPCQWWTDRRHGSTFASCISVTRPRISFGS